jgi:alanyl-tRNA synthetase
MQQHTGQHILSQAIYKLLGKESESLHIGREISSIDIETEDMAYSDLTYIEKIANDAVMSDLPIKTYFVSSTRGLDLRKDTSLTENIRIVDIEGYDKTPCGGTHLDRSGKVGPIKITKCYKKGKLQRMEFVCGLRCLKLMQEQGSALLNLGNMLMVPQGSIVDRVKEMDMERKDLIRANMALQDTLMENEARLIIEDAPVHQGIRTVHGIMEDPALVQYICKSTIDMKRTVCLLGAKTDRGAVLTFSSSKDSGIDVSEILKKTLEQFGGRGGGSRNFASGSCRDDENLSDALKKAAEKINGN